MYPEDSSFFVAPTLKGRPYRSNGVKYWWKIMGMKILLNHEKLFFSYILDFRILTNAISFSGLLRIIIWLIIHINMCHKYFLRMRNNIGSPSLLYNPFPWRKQCFSDNTQIRKYILKRELRVPHFLCKSHKQKDQKPNLISNNQVNLIKFSILQFHITWFMEWCFYHGFLSFSVT